MFAQEGGKIRKPRLGVSPEEDHRFKEDVYKATSNILVGLNKGLSLGDGTNDDENQNMDIWHSGAILTPGVANTQFTVNHGLGRIPIGYHLYFNDQNGQIYASGVWSVTQAFFKWSIGVTTIKIYLF